MSYSPAMAAAAYSPRDQCVPVRRRTGHPACMCALQSQSKRGGGVMFVGFQPVSGALVPFAYDWPMVGLSFLISVCGAYVGLRWSRRVRLPDGRLDVDRLLCASVALGGGAV